MDAWVWIVIAIVGVVVIGGDRRGDGAEAAFGAVAGAVRRRVGRTVEDTGDRREAERELREREKEHEELDLQPLSEAARSRYAAEWQRVQAQFVDDPEGAVRAGDRLVQQAMGERGYPVDDGDFESRASTLFGRARRRRAGLPPGPRALAALRRRPGVDGGSPPGDGALPLPLRAAARGRARRGGEPAMSEDEQSRDEDADPHGRRARPTSCGRLTASTPRRRHRRARAALRRGRRRALPRPLAGDPGRVRGRAADRGERRRRPRRGADAAAGRDLLRGAVAAREQWGGDGEVSTEELRVALQRYRSFFDRLLAA